MTLLGGGAGHIAARLVAAKPNPKLITRLQSVERQTGEYECHRADLMADIKINHDASLDISVHRKR